MEYFIFLRDLLVNNFSVSLKSIEYSKYRLTNNYLFFICRLIPFYFLKVCFNFFKIKYIYLVDNLYFSNYSNNKIMPILTSVEVYNNNNKMDITTIIKKYSYTVPFWYIIENEKLKEFEKFQFKFFTKSKFETRIFETNYIENKLVQEIF